MPNLNAVYKKLIKKLPDCQGPAFLSFVSPYLFGGFSLKNQISVCVF